MYASGQTLERLSGTIGLIASILIIDDDPGIGGMLCAVLRREGFDYDLAADGESACQKLRSNDYDAVVLDLMLPKINGFEIIRFLKSDRPAMLRRVIVVTAVAEITLRDFHDQKHVWALLRKPFELTHFVDTVTACAADANASSEEGALDSRAAEAVS